MAKGIPADSEKGRALAREVSDPLDLDAIEKLCTPSAKGGYKEVPTKEATVSEKVATVTLTLPQARALLSAAGERLAGEMDWDERGIERRTLDRASTSLGHAVWEVENGRAPGPDVASLSRRWSA